MDLHNLIQGSGPMWNSKRSVPKVCIQLQGRTVVYQKSMGYLPSPPNAEQEAAHSSSFQAKKCNPFMWQYGEGKGKGQSPLRGLWVQQKHSFTQHLLLYFTGLEISQL